MYMAWLLLVALIFVVIILGIIIGATKLFEYVRKEIEKREINKRLKMVDYEIELKNHEKEALESSTSSVSQIKELEEEISELKKLHKDIKKGE